METQEGSGRTKAAQREATIRALLHHAREAFAEDGYRAASLDTIAGAAGVTKGALYHHFRGGKRALFGAVAAQLHAEIAERVASSAPEADAWEQLIAGCRTFLEATLEPAAQRILLLDAPAVLGWEGWRELDAASSVQHLEEALARLVAEEVIDDLPLRPMVHLLSGAMNEAALAMAQSSDPQRRLRETMVVLERLLAGLASEDPRPPR
jgi:AcrR family transcriptional regulator